MSDAYVPGPAPVQIAIPAGEELVAAGQRKVNLIWEYTQSAVAMLVVLANIAVWLVTVTRSVRGQEMLSPPSGLTDALFVIVGFYYGRTNHVNIGGVGRKQGER